MDKIVIKQSERRRRSELTLPTFTYHQWEAWRPVLEKACKGAWDSYQTMFTLADRREYPEQTVVHHYDYHGLAKKFLCGHQKAVNIIKALYEYGLIDIYETKNSKKGPKNIIVVYDVPIYNDTQYCELQHYRKWEDRNSKGQFRAKKAGMVSAELRKKETASDVENPSSVEITLDKNTPENTPSSVEITLDNQCENHTIDNNPNIANKKDDDDEATKKLRDLTENEIQAIYEKYVELFGNKFDNQISLDDMLYQLLYRAYRKGTGIVIYSLERLYERVSMPNAKKITSLLRWIDSCIKNPEKFPPIVSFEGTTERKNTNPNHPEVSDERKKLYDALLMS